MATFSVGVLGFESFICFNAIHIVKGADGKSREYSPLHCPCLNQNSTLGHVYLITAVLCSSD